MSPPRKAAGTDATTNGKVSRPIKWPARTKLTRAIPATKRFNVSAVVAISSGRTTTNDRTAKYPDAPPCPTDAYTRAITKKTGISHHRLCMVTPFDHLQGMRQQGKQHM